MCFASNCQESSALVPSMHGTIKCRVIRTTSTHLEIFEKMYLVVIHINNFMLAFLVLFS